MEFKVDDRVVVINADKIYNSAIKDGMTGTVIAVSPSNTAGEELLVQFDKNIGGHNGNSVMGIEYGQGGHCWWVGQDCFTLAEPEPQVKDVPLGRWETRL